MVGGYGADIHVGRVYAREWGEAVTWGYLGSAMGGRPWSFGYGWISPTSGPVGSRAVRLCERLLAYVGHGRSVRYAHSAQHGATAVSRAMSAQSWEHDSRRSVCIMLCRAASRSLGANARRQPAVLTAGEQHNDTSPDNNHSTNPTNRQHKPNNPTRPDERPNQNSRPTRDSRSTRGRNTHPDPRGTQTPPTHCGQR